MADTSDGSAERDRLAIDADIAMYTAKAQCKNRVERFAPAMRLGTRRCPGQSPGTVLTVASNTKGHPCPEVTFAA